MVRRSAELQNAKRSIVRVGKGRGFVVAGKRDRMILSAAHCLPFFPPCISASYLEERTYPNLVGALSERPSLMTECLFVDPIADIAVLGPPDGQVLYDQNEAYENFLESCTAISIVDCERPSAAWLLSLKGEWCTCTVRPSSKSLWIENAKQGVAGGMSGSPIITSEGKAIGMVCIAGGTSDRKHTQGGPNPRLIANLPGWLLREIGCL